MNKVFHNQTTASSTGSVALAISAALATGQAYWPVNDPPDYVINESPAYSINETVPSYSEVNEQIRAAIENPHSTFVDQMASIYAMLSQRQQLLGEEFQAAIFDDLDSLYES